MVLTAKHKDNAEGVPHYMGLAGRQLSLMLSTVATCGFLLFGYDQGVMSGIISAEDFVSQWKVIYALECGRYLTMLSRTHTSLRPRTIRHGRLLSRRFTKLVASLAPSLS